MRCFGFSRTVRMALISVIRSCVKLPGKDLYPALAARVGRRVVTEYLATGVRFEGVGCMGVVEGRGGGEVRA